MEPRFQAPERQKGLGAKGGFIMSEMVEIQGEWFFHPASFSEEHLQGYKAMVNMAGEVESMEALLAAAGDTDAAHGVMAILKPAFECMRLICQSHARIDGNRIDILWYDPNILDEEGDDPTVFLKQLQATEKEHFALATARMPGRYSMQKDAEVIAEIGIVDGDLHVFLPGLDTIVMRLGRQCYDLDDLLAYADESGGAVQKLMNLLLSEDPDHQQQGLELLRLQDDDVIDDWMALAYDQGSFAVAEANYGTLTDTFLKAVFEHPRTDFSQLEQLNLSSMPGARLTHLDFLQKTPNLQMLNLSLQGNLTSIEGVRGLRKLRLLDLAHCDSVASMDVLAGCSALESLELTFCRPDGLGFLRHLTALRELKLSGITIDDPSLISNLTQLESLEIGELTVSDLSCFAELKQLRYLTLEGIPDGGWDDLSPLRNLGALERFKMPNPDDPLFGDGLQFEPQKDPDSWNAWLGTN